MYVAVSIVAIFMLVAYVLLQPRSPSKMSDLSTQSANEQEVGEIDRNNCLTDDCLEISDLDYPAGELPANIKSALDEAIKDEYKAVSTYEQVTKSFGQVRPFSMIKGAELQHIASLRAIYDKYGLVVPENPWLNKIEVPDTLKQACQIGVDAEIANVALYRDSLIPSVANYKDIAQVFTKLMNASEQKHLPAFERCN